MEGGWKESDLHVSYVEMKNKDDCSVHAPHFVDSVGRTEMRIRKRVGTLTMNF